ncbi:MAG: hypothetical protein OIF34_01625 [Porticoccaceae bacterium]|nr:hypothetical protein [Porticoccaceae bacterium]
MTTFYHCAGTLLREKEEAIRAMLQECGGSIAVLDVLLEERRKTRDAEMQLELLKAQKLTMIHFVSGAGDNGYWEC